VGALAVLLWLAAPIALAQSEPGWWAGAPVSTAGLGHGRYSDVGMLYERTFLRVDVLYLSMRFDSETASRLEQIATAGGFDAEAERRIVDTAMGAEGVLVRSRFLRDLSLDQFLEGIRENLADAQAAGLLSDEERRTILADVEVSYEPLRAPGIRAEDTLWYRIRGDTVHIVYQNIEGEHVVDEYVEGPQHRRAVLGGYLAPGSDFRSPLARSLFRDPD
jgi:hypothetical protein